MIPTLFGIMLINFVIIHVAPGGPVEQLIAEVTGQGSSATDRVSPKQDRPNLIRCQPGKWSKRQVSRSPGPGRRVY